MAFSKTATNASKSFAAFAAINPLAMPNTLRRGRAEDAVALVDENDGRQRPGHRHVKQGVDPLCPCLACGQICGREAVEGAACVRANRLRAQRLTGAARPEQQQAAHRATGTCCDRRVLFREKSGDTCANNLRKTSEAL